MAKIITINLLVITPELLNDHIPEVAKGLETLDCEFADFI